MKIRPFCSFLVIGLAAALAGCLDQDQKFVLNPDGSGKFTTTAIISSSPLAGGLPGAAGAPKDLAKAAALQMLRSAEGVDLWSEVIAEQLPDGKSKLSATAYFPDLNKLKLSGGGKTGGPQAMTITSHKEGDKWVVEMGVPDSKTTKTDTPKAARTPEEIKAVVAQGQQQWAATKVIAEPMVQDLKVKTTVVVGGSIQNAVGFAREGDNAGVLQLNGKRVYDALDKMIMDPKLAEEAVVNGGDLMSAMRDQKRLQKIVMESMTEGKGMPQLVVTPGAPLFDYKTEVEKARAAQSEQTKALVEESKKAPADKIKIAPPKTKKSGE